MSSQAGRKAQSMRLTLPLLLLLVCACAPAPSPSPTPIVSPEPLATQTPEKVATEPRLVIRVGGEMRRYRRSELLAHPALKTMTIEDRSGYEGQTMTFQVVPLALLFDGLAPRPDETLQYDTLDGFSSSIDPKRLLNTDPKGSIAYLAIEPPDQPWPPFPHGKYGAAPFYVVWPDPELSDIGREEWPFKLKVFKAAPSIEKRFPEVLPDPTLGKDSQVRLGFDGFVKNCFPCHTMNGQGSARFGPDLNTPHSPTEYFAPGYLRKMIRDPQSLRHWEGAKMSAFSEEEISDQELDAILAYLDHMAKRRAR